MAELSYLQRLCIERIAKLPSVILYEEDSLSGNSWTLRYKRAWPTRGGKRVLCKTAQGAYFMARRTTDNKWFSDSRSIWKSSEIEGWADLDSAEEV